MSCPASVGYSVHARSKRRFHDRESLVSKLVLFLLRIATCAQVIELCQGSREDPQGEGREKRAS